MKCTECPDYRECHKKRDLRRYRHYCSKAKGEAVFTNADRIRAMTNEELAEWIVAACDTDLEEFCSNPKRTRSCDNECVLCVMEYLDQPAEEVSDDTT